MIKVVIGYAVALLFWFFMFSPWTAGSLNFWYTMLTATGILTIYSLVIGKHNNSEIYRFKFKWILIGLLSAALLYLVFYIGNEVSRIIFDFTDREVGGIYSTKVQASKVFIGTALVLWIGPAEEVFWRGFAQHELSKRFSPRTAFIINTLVYAFVHIWAFNFMLFMAALICGLFWGYMYLKFKSVWPALISHAIWDLFIFVIIPIS